MHYVTKGIVRATKQPGPGPQKQPRTAQGQPVLLAVPSPKGGTAIQVHRTPLNRSSAQ